METLQTRGGNPISYHVYYDNDKREIQRTGTSVGGLYIDIYLYTLSVLVLGAVRIIVE